MKDPLNFIIDAVQYDFCEDDDEVQGNWKIVRRDDGLVDVFYIPFDDSPFPKSWGRYRIEAVELREGEDVPVAYSS